MIKNHKYIIFNSALLFIIASIVEMTLHECGHFVMAILVNAKEISLHHNYVSEADEGLSLLKILLIKGTGPVVSLMIGLVFHYVCSMRSKRDLFFLFNLYMSVFGYIGFLGYLLIAPFFTGGDTGYICYALGFPIWLTMIIAVMGGLILFLLMRRLTKHFVEMGTWEIITHKETRKPFIHSLILIPMIIGIIITTLMNLPVPIPLSLIAPICSPFTILWTYGDVLTRNYADQKENHEFQFINRINIGVILIFIFTIILNRFLVNGIYWH